MIAQLFIAHIRGRWRELVYIVYKTGDTVHPRGRGKRQVLVLGEPGEAALKGGTECVLYGNLGLTDRRRWTLY